MRFREGRQVTYCHTAIDAPEADLGDFSLLMVMGGGISWVLQLRAHVKGSPARGVFPKFSAGEASSGFLGRGLGCDYSDPWWPISGSAAHPAETKGKSVGSSGGIPRVG